MTPDDIDRKRLKQKVLERWENEGGKIETDPKGAAGNDPPKDHRKEVGRSSGSNKNPIKTSNSTRVKRKSR